MQLGVQGPSGIITLQRNYGAEINGADRQYSSVHLFMYIYPARFPPRTVISHSTNISVDSTGSTLTSQFVATQTPKRTFLKGLMCTLNAMLIWTR